MDDLKKYYDLTKYFTIANIYFSSSPASPPLAPSSWIIIIIVLQFHHPLFCSCHTSHPGEATRHSVLSSQRSLTWLMSAEDDGWWKKIIIFFLLPQHCHCSLVLDHYYYCSSIPPSTLLLLSYQSPRGGNPALCAVEPTLADLVDECRG